jgi:hypothetical protein
MMQVCWKRRAIVHRGLLVVLVCALVACSNPPSGDAKDRVQTLAADPIKAVLPPGGELLGESIAAGHETQAPAGQGRPTVRRDFSFTGDPRLAALAVLEQGQAAGWSLIADCDFGNEGTFFVRGSKRITDSTGTFPARFEAQIWIPPPTDEGGQSRPEVNIEISAPYPGEEQPQESTTPTSAPSPGSSCLG